MARISCRICFINDGQELLTCSTCSRTFHRHCFAAISGSNQTGGNRYCNGCFDQSSCWTCGTTDNQKTFLSCVICNRKFHMECQKMFVCPICGITRAVIYPDIGWETTCLKCNCNESKKNTLKCCTCSVRVHLECYEFKHTCDCCKIAAERVQRQSLLSMQ